MQPIPFNDLSRRTAALREPMISAIARVVDRGWFILGPELEAFEREFRDWCGSAHAVGVANGTDAIELALRAHGVGAGDEVVAAPNAGMYAATAIRAIGAIPVFADVEPRRLTIDPDSVGHVVGSRCRAIVATHLYGRMADMPRLVAFAASLGIPLIEDCAQSHGARLDGVAAGAWGDAGCFSFYPTKNLGALGDGGLVTCRTPDIAARIRRLRQYGWERKYVSAIGPARNSRLDEMQAAVLRMLLPLVDAANRRRRDIASAYAAVDRPGLTHPDVAGDDYVAHLYVVRSAERESLRRRLTEAGVATDIHYPLLDPEQPSLAGAFRAPAPLVASAAAVREIVSLPCYPEMTDAEVARVRAAIADWTP
jgi:dTDP-4-amino-4,6-dideoxygalactose transaminase